MICQDPLIPIRTVIDRIEKQISQLEREYQETKRLEFKKRYVVQVSIAIYKIEIDKLLELAASTQPIIGKPDRAK
jgi:hypothetical protein